MAKTSIGWTDHSLNPVRARMKDGSNRVPGHFCIKISPGCAHCYASNFQKRFGMVEYIERNQELVESYLDERVLTEPLRRKKPTKYFPFDMTDLFFNGHPDEWIDKFFAVAALCPQHVFQVLTKRSERMLEYFQGITDVRIDNAARTLGYSLIFEGMKMFDWPLPNVWLGVSAEDQQRADERHEHLKECPAVVRWYSVEPMLSEIDLPLDGISWVVIGGESGRQARPFPVDAAKRLVDQCQAAGVACFFKQFGSNPHRSLTSAGYVVSSKLDDSAPVNMKHPKGEDPSEWPDWCVQQFPQEVTARST